MKRKTGKIILMYVGLFFCACSNLTNPFQNKDEARAEITNWNWPDSVSINIFSTYNIPVRVLLGEHLDSFKVHVDNNRLWSSQDSVIYRNGIRPGYIYSFPFSFYDTGYQKIKVISYRSNGDTVADSCILHAVSPLKQSPISGVVGDSIMLNTLPIKDKQVLYIWDFHNGVVIKEYACSVRIRITAPFTSRFGQLYVEDYSGHRSPVTLFEITSQSPQKELLLTCINDSIRGDTVFSAEAQMKFRLEVSGAQQLTKALINGQNFHESQKKGDLFLLGYNLKELDTTTAPQKLDVTVTDDQGRSVSRTFYVQFIKVTPEIKVAYPEDSLHTAASSVNVLGVISKFKQNSILYLFARNNGINMAKAVITSTNSIFSFEIPLLGTSNHISLELFSDSLMESSMLALKDFYVFYDPAYVDTIAPQIREILCNGTPVDSTFTSRTDTMLLEIDAIDNSNKLTVTVNGQVVDKGSNELFYSTKVILTHKKEPAVIVIQAKDSVGYTSYDTIFVRYNRLPQWMEIPSYKVAIADDDNLFKISVIDLDGDPVLVTMTIPLKSGNMVMNASSGQVLWKPLISDTGIYNVILEASDEYEVTDTFFTVLVKGKDATPVQFSEIDFPDTLWIGEALSVTLKALPLTGTPPFRYEAGFIDNKPSNIHEGSDSVLNWIPKIEDAGLRKLRVKITDSLGYSDSVTAEIRVLLATVRWDESMPVPIKCYEDSTLTIRAILSKPLTFPVSIGYRLAFPYVPGATKEDFISLESGVIQFKKGDTISSITIRIFNDSIPEITEKFNVEFIENDSLGSDIPLECEIIDNDLVYFYFDQTEIDHTERNRTDTAIVKISKPLEIKLELSCLVDSSSTAKLGEDFTLDDSIVVFEPGDTIALVILNIIDDIFPEGEEKIVLRLKSDNSFAAPRTGFFGNPYRNTFTYTIKNDDIPIKYNFTLPLINEYENDTVVNIAVKLSKAPKAPLTVKYSLDNDPTKTTAILNSDFSFIDNTGLLTFAAGETVKEIGIKLIDDTIPWRNVFFTLNLDSDSELAEPGDTTSCRFVINSNEVEVRFSSTEDNGQENWYETPYCWIVIDPASTKPVEVYFRVVDSESDADSGSDYTIQAPGFVRFMPGETQKDIMFQVINDNQKEVNEKVVLEITGVSDRRIAYIGSNKRMTVGIISNE